MTHKLCIQTLENNGMTITVGFPVGKLRNFVNHIVEIEGSPSFHFERILPRNRIELLFNLGDDLSGVPGLSGSKVTCQTAVLSGTRSAFFDSYPAKKFHILAVEFRPEVCCALFGVLPLELTNQDIEATLCIPGIDGIWQQLKEMENKVQRFCLIRQWLAEMVVALNYSPHNLSQWIIKQIEHNPTCRVKSLEKKSGYSRKHLYSVFKRHMGVSIKSYQELKRFDRLTQAIRSQKPARLTDLAFQFDFFDQSHFIKCCKRFSGLTPSEFLDKYPANGPNIPFGR